MTDAVPGQPARCLIPWNASALLASKELEMLGIGVIHEEEELPFPTSSLGPMSQQQIDRAAAFHLHEVWVAHSYHEAVKSEPTLRATKWATMHPFVPPVLATA